MQTKINDTMVQKTGAERRRAAPWLRKIGVTVGTALLAGCLAFAPLPARAEVGGWNTAAVNRQPITGLFGRPDGLFTNQLVLTDGNMRATQFYTVRRGEGTFTLSFSENGEDVSGRLYASTSLSGRLNIGACVGTDEFWGVGMLGRYPDGKWTVVYTNAGSNGTLVGAVDRCLNSEFNTSLRISAPLGSGSPSYALGCDYELGNGQIGLSSTLGTTDEISAYLLGRTSWGNVRLDAINLGHNTQWSIMVNIPTN